MTEGHTGGQWSDWESAVVHVSCSEHLQMILSMPDAQAFLPPHPGLHLQATNRVIGATFWIFKSQCTCGPLPRPVTRGCS